MNKNEFASAYTGLLRADLNFFAWDKTSYMLDINKLDNEFLMQQPVIYLLLAYSLLFAVLEFLKDKNSIPPAIASDVDVVYDKLRLTRNAIFHIQDKYLNEKVARLADLPEESIKNIRHIHNFLKAYFENPVNIPNS
jgi:hypothetical protein